MKTNKLKPFQELNHSNRLVRLEWFGGVQGNLEEFDNPLIEGIFTPVEYTDTATGESILKPLTNEQFMASIAVGYLPIQFIGKYFRGGKIAPLGEFPIPERITFDLDVSDYTSITECCLPDLQIAPASDFISPRFKNFANPAGLKKLHGTLVSSSHKKIKKFPAPQIVVIHELELIRFYLTNSSFSCQNMFTSAFSKSNLEKRVVNTIHEPVTFDAQTDLGRFVYRHGYKEIDAPILGRILFDRSVTALNAAQRVSSKMIADRVNTENGLTGYPRTLFPFTGRTQLVLSGRRINTANGFIFLASRIHSCSAPFPYKILSYCDEIAPGGAPAPEDSPIAFKNWKTRDTGPAHDDDNQGNNSGESTSSERPSSASVQLKFEMGRRDYLGLKDVTLIKEKLRDCTHRSEKKSHRYLNKLVNASTGGGTSGESTAARQSITERTFIPSAVTPDLETFIKIMRGIRTLHPHWDIDTIIVGNGIRIGNVNVSEFPAVPCQKLKNIMRQFSYIDYDKQVPRRFICMQVCVNGRYIYLFEAQRRLREPPPSNDSGLSPFKEELSILLLRGSGYEELQGDDFIPLIEQTVKNKTWPNEGELDGFIRDRALHGLGVQTPDEMCARVAQSIQKNLGG